MSVDLEVAEAGEDEGHDHYHVWAVLFSMQITINFVFHSSNLWWCFFFASVIYIQPIQTRQPFDHKDQKQIQIYIFKLIQTSRCFDNNSFYIRFVVWQYYHDDISYDDSCLYWKIHQEPEECDLRILPRSLLCNLRFHLKKRINI